MRITSLPMSSRARWAAPLAVIALLATTAACGSDDTHAAPTPTASTPAASASAPSSASSSPDPVTNADDPTTWSSGPGFIGPFHVGDNATNLRGIGLLKPSQAQVCDLKWQSSDALEKKYVSVEFRNGDPDALDSVVAGNFHGATPYTLRTAEGIGIGSTIEELKAAYPDLRYGKWDNEGGYYIGWVRETHQGSIFFNVGGTVDDGGAVSGDGSHVTLIAVSGSPFNGILSGC